MKEILKQHMSAPLPESLRPKKKKPVWAYLASSFALLLVIVVSFQLSMKAPKKLASDKWWEEFDQEMDQEMELVLAELDQV